jgi:hypothetical protein
MAEEMAVKEARTSRREAGTPARVPVGRRRAEKEESRTLALETIVDPFAVVAGLVGPIECSCRLRQGTQPH